MHRLRWLAVAALCLLPPLAGAVPVTWTFAGDVSYLEVRQVELPFKLGALVDGEFVPTRFSGTLTFDPLEAKFDSASLPRTPTDPGGWDPLATECLSIHSSCSYTLPLAITFDIGGHVLVSRTQLGRIGTALNYMDLTGFDFGRGADADLALDDTPYVGSLGIVLHATNIPGATLPLPSVAPLLEANAGTYAFFTIYPEPYTATPNLGASLIAGLTSVASVPDPSALWCFALSAGCILARRFWRTPIRCATFRPTPP